MNKYLSVKALLALAIVTPTLVDGATIRVPADQPNIQAAVDACDGDDTVLIADGIYSGTGNHDVIIPDTNLTIRSENGPEFTIIDLAGTADHKGFILGSGALGTSRNVVFSLEDLTIQNGDGVNGGVLEATTWRLSIDNCHFENNRADNGAVLYLDSCVAEITNCRFNSNVAVNTGGAIYGLDSTSRISATRFDFNIADRGGALANYTGIDIENCVFLQNQATWGAAMFSQRENAHFTLTGTFFTRNSGAPAIYMWKSAAAVDHCTFFGNDGVFELNSSSPVSTNTIFADNSGMTLTCNDSFPGSESNPDLDYCIVSDSGLDFPGCPVSIIQMPNNYIGDPMFCDTASNDFRLQSGSPAEGNASDGSTIGAAPVGCLPTDVEDSDPILPNAFTLHQNHPNPFNLETTIVFDLPRTSAARLDIYNSLGQLVRTIDLGRHSAGTHRVEWDGTASDGSVVASGLYLYRLITDNESSDSKKMLLLK